MTRRGVLTGAAALAGVSALPQFLTPLTRTAIGHVVVDDRLASSAHFASRFDAARVHAVNALDDLCNRWYTRLRAQVLADTGHIAGLTSWMDYVVMRSCAAEVGYVGAFHAEHVPAATGLEHIVTAYPDLLAQLVQRAQPQSWAHAMGEALASGVHLRSRFLPGQVFRATTAAPAFGHVRMVTWVFSPRHSV
jgi:hypothetical protein